MQIARFPFLFRSVSAPSSCLAGPNRAASVESVSSSLPFFTILIGGNGHKAE